MELFLHVKTNKTAFMSHFYLHPEKHPGFFLKCMFATNKASVLCLQKVYEGFGIIFSGKHVTNGNLSSVMEQLF